MERDLDERELFKALLLILLGASLILLTTLTPYQISILILLPVGINAQLLGLALIIIQLKKEKNKTF